jgi:hypothetical protein
MNPPAKRYPLWLAVLLAIVAFAFWRLGAPKTPPAPTPAAAPASASADKNRATAESVCSTCHLFPEPLLFARHRWEAEILPRMAYTVGLEKFDFASHPGGDLVRAAGVFPTNPVVSPEQWQAVANFYRENATASEPPSGSRPAIEMGLPGFSAQITLAAIDAQHHQLLVGDGNQLQVLSAHGELQHSVPLASPAAHVLFRKDAAPLLTLLGSFMPNDLPQGEVTPIDLSAAPRSERSLLASLPRPVETLEADFDGDGRTDLLVCGFGNYVGRLSWFRSLPDARWEEHVLEPVPGAVGAGIGDFDGDGWPDVAVLMAQAREALVVHLNRGLASWPKRVVREFHPSWGSSSLQVVDFNGDGRLDLLVANGDNADSDSGRDSNFRPPRNSWHGVRLYEQNADRSFTEKWFLPLHGAYRALAADFNQDGLMDLAAVSYFPDYERTPQESFVLFLQASPGKFRAFSMPECLTGRWITLDCGDLDGDGDIDILLGSYPRGPGRVPEVFANAWATKGNRLLILRNGKK